VSEPATELEAKPPQPEGNIKQQKCAVIPKRERIPSDVSEQLKMYDFLETEKAVNIIQNKNMTQSQL
jgi:hypothetical protein